jgi:NhaA family Na+:H+ antiporter
LNLTYDEALSNFAFKFNLRRYIKSRFPPGVAAFLLTLATVDDLGAIAVIAVFFAKGLVIPYMAGAVVGRCRLTISKPVFKPSIVSALEATN